MSTNYNESKPTISGVPEEVQQNIIEDLEKKNTEVKKTDKVFKIGISVSDNEDLARLGYSNIHLKDLIVEIARNLLIRDMSIVYGGDLRKEGYTRIFADLAFQYRSANEPRKIHFENYFAYPIYCLLTADNELEFQKYRTEIHKITPPDGLVNDPNKFIPYSSVESKYVWSKSLSLMREIMIDSSDARILSGGKINNYLGKVPGVIEEAKITLDLNKPLYLVGAFGGGAKHVASALEGSKFSFVNDQFHQNNTYQEFVSYYNSTNSHDPIDLVAYSDYFASYGIEKLSHNNGLTSDENKRLFVTPHVAEIIYLVSRGLNQILPK